MEINLRNVFYFSILLDVSYFSILLDDGKYSRKSLFCYLCLWWIILWCKLKLFMNVRITSVLLQSSVFGYESYKGRCLFVLNWLLLNFTLIFDAAFENKRHSSSYIEWSIISPSSPYLPTTRFQLCRITFLLFSSLLNVI